ncbi:hypothetical protein [unidentified bacterial endosymbiont]|uniref:hypothetical protein n=1 Tax=unidentified bacterial endosymbiont TaxID=2355 RepID=UPI00209FE301|nr:hypothetical protein [unidentified bacterial endosymbiont]
MILFSRQDVAHWSYFSGDNNKLHSSSPPEKCIVQGMLVFVHMLNWIELRPSTKNSAFKIESFFRKPIFTDDDYRLALLEKNKITLNSNANRNVMTTTWYRTEKWLKGEKQIYSDQVSIDNGSIKKFRNDFHKIFTKTTTKLSFYCALCFSMALGSRTFLTYKNIVYENTDKYFGNNMVIHVSQSAEWDHTFPDKNIVEQINLLDLLIIKIHDHDISSTVTVRSVTYHLSINGNIVLKMKSMFLIKGNKTS